MLPEELKQNVTVYGPLFPEPVQIIIAVPMGSSVKLIGKGVGSSTVYEPILSTEQLAQLKASPSQEPFDGDASKFRLGVEAMRLGLAYEYDPYFSLSIARVDPLPHQLEAVYDYFHKAAAHPVSAGRRSRSRKNHHGLPSHQGTQDTRTGEANAHRDAGQPVVPMAARTQGQVPLKFRGRPRRCAPRQLRHESLAAEKSGAHFRLVGFACR
jgi:hypothetical protein